MAIPNTLPVASILGKPYRGMTQGIRDSFPRVKNLVRGLSINYTSYPDRSVVFNSVLRSLVDGLNTLYPSPSSALKARQALSAVQASATTFTFIMHYFKVASKNGIGEEAAVRKVLDKFNLILISTSRIPYPSKKGKALIEALLQPQDVQIETIRHLFPDVDRESIAAAAAAGFNPMALLNDEAAPPSIRPMDEASRQYMRDSKEALRSYGELLARYSSGPKPLWVFLLRDAHLLSLLAEKVLPGKKMELDVCKLSLAGPEELGTIFENSGFNVGTNKSLPPIGHYTAIQQAIGQTPTIPPPGPVRPKEVIEQLLQQEHQPDSLTADYTSFRRAQLALRDLAVPEQVTELLRTSGIVDELEKGRPVVFVDTGFRGTLPMLLQTALTRMATESGVEPNVHIWLDYVQTQYKELVVNSHRSGAWAVSPLDGCVSLNRILLPAEEGHETDVFTTPFDAMRQSRILSAVGQPSDGPID